MKVKKAFLYLISIATTTVIIISVVNRKYGWTIKHLEWKLDFSPDRKSFKNAGLVENVYYITSKKDTTSLKAQQIYTTAVPKKYDIGTEKINKTRNKVFKVRSIPNILITTYMRSGSSFFGELMKYGGDIFYSFEPLWGIYGQGYRSMNKICYRNNTCVDPGNKWQTVNGTIWIIKQLYNCEISTLPRQVLYSFIKFPLSSGYSRKCVPVKPAKKVPKIKPGRNMTQFGGPIKYGRYESKFKECVNNWENICKNADARVIKTIRLSPELAEILINEIPDLRIVHLTRDPRGIIRSRINVGNVQSNGLIEHTTHLCYTMQNDVIKMKQSALTKKGYIIPVSFECLTSQPHHVAEILFQKLHLNFARETIVWLDKHARNGDKVYQSHVEQQEQRKNRSIAKSFPDLGYRILKANSETIAHAWKTRLSEEIVQQIDKICVGLYKEMGIGKFHFRTKSKVKPYGHNMCL